MVKVGQKIRLTETDVLEVEHITTDELVIGNVNKNPYITRLEYVKAAIEDEMFEIIEDAPSVEDQLKELGWSIKNSKYNIDFYNIELDINYDKNCQILKMSNESIINKKDLKLILQYIEENENGKV